MEGIQDNLQVSVLSQKRYMVESISGLISSYWKLFYSEILELAKSRSQSLFFLTLMPAQCPETEKQLLS